MFATSFHLRWRIGGALEYIDTDAAETFYLLTLRSYDIGFIGWSGLQERLSCLVRMLNPNDAAYKALRQTVPDELLVDARIDEEAEIEVRLERGQPQDEIGARRADEPVIPAAAAMHLFVSSVAGMKQWTFHKFDRDPFPSVPHGHQHKLKHPKCDPYTGRVYDGHREEVQGERLSNKTRIALWKDPDFREFALKAITWYEHEYPNYRFRVAHPYRLPRVKR
jgi:hypothetical protein